MSPAGRQPAFGQDQHQGAEPQRLRQPGVIEPDTRARLAEGQPQAQEHQQARQPDPVRHPGRHDRREHDRGADQQDQTQAARRHCRLRISCPGASRWWPPVCPISGHQQGSHHRRDASRVGKGYPAAAKHGIHGQGGQPDRLD